MNFEQYNKKTKQLELIEALQKKFPGQQQFEEFLQNYKVDYQKILGKGSFGVVYCGFNIKNPKQEIAVKQIQVSIEDLIAESTESNEIIPIELRINEIIGPHKNFIQVHKVFFWTLKYEDEKDSQDAQIYIIMEKAVTNLEKFAINNYLQEIDIIKIGCQVVQALKHLQKFHISHRDIKPLNILLGQDDVFKLADLGICRENQSTLIQSTVVRNVGGTLHFMCPEVKEYFEQLNQGDGENQQPLKYDTYKGDIFSTGILLLFLMLNIDKSIGIYKKIEKLNSKKSGGELKLQLIFQDLAHKGQYDTNFVQLVEKMVEYNPKSRLTIDQCLKNQVFQIYEEKKQLFDLQKQEKIIYQLQQELDQQKNQFQQDIKSVEEKYLNQIELIKRDNFQINQDQMVEIQQSKSQILNLDLENQELLEEKKKQNEEIKKLNNTAAINEQIHKGQLQNADEKQKKLESKIIQKSKEYSLERENYQNEIQLFQQKQASLDANFNTLNKQMRQLNEQNGELQQSLAQYKNKQIQPICFKCYLPIKDSKLRNFNCNLCRKAYKGTSYFCSTCDFDVCQTCYKKCQEF